MGKKLDYTLGEWRNFKNRTKETAIQVGKRKARERKKKEEIVKGALKITTDQQIKEEIEHELEKLDKIKKRGGNRKN